MHIKPIHAELDTSVLYPFIRAYPLGLLTTSNPSPNTSTIQTSHIPFVLDTPLHGPARLRAHITRANPQAKALISAAAAEDDSTLDNEVLIIFQAPINHYVTPKFYVATKPDTGKVVPTWNYAAVQVYGKVHVHSTGDDSATFLQRQIEDLSAQSENAAGYADRPWKVTDAPDKYINILKKAIVGIEIEITRVEGRWKMSQEMGDGDWKGVVAGFEALGTEAGTEIAHIIAKRGQARDQAEGM
jgi:transcriptional regulator